MLGGDSSALIVSPFVWKHVQTAICRLALTKPRTTSSRSTGRIHVTAKTTKDDQPQIVHEQVRHAQRAAPPLPSPKSDNKRDVIHRTDHLQIRIGLSSLYYLRDVPCWIKEEQWR